MFGYVIAWGNVVEVRIPCASFRAHEFVRPISAVLALWYDNTWHNADYMP